MNQDPMPGSASPYARSEYGSGTTFSARYRSRRRRWLAGAVVAVFVMAAVIVGAFAFMGQRDIPFVFPLTSDDQLAEASFRQELKDAYAYNQLSADDQDKYRTVLKALTTREKLAYPAYDLEDASRIESYVKADHPELEDLAQFCLWEGGLFTPAYISGFYYVDEEAQASLQAKLDAAKQECLASIAPEADDYAKAKAVYEWIARTTEYDNEAALFTGKMDIRASEDDPSVIAPDSRIPRDYGQTVANVFVDHKAVCAGYARAFQDLMQDLGIECVYVKGTVGFDSHAWCVAKLDGEYYHIDPTWGDPQYADAAEDEQADIALLSDVDYNFFCVTTDDILLTHTVDAGFALPACTSMADNYYVHEGLYFGSADAERLGMLATAAQAEGRAVMVRCSDETVFSTLLHDWLENGELAAYIPSGAYRYGSTESPFYLLAVAPLDRSS